MTAESKEQKKEKMIAELKRVASRYKNEYFQKREFTHYAKGFTSREIAQAFGSWTKALTAIGITDIPKRPKRKRKVVPRAEKTYTALLKELITVWMEKGQQPTEEEWSTEQHTFATEAFIKQFGSWEAACEEAKSMPQSVEEELYPEDQEKKMEQPSQGFHKRAIPEKIEEQALARYRKRCSQCGRMHIEEEGVFVKVVYIKAPSKGGVAKLSNLKTLCNICIDESKKKKRWY